MKLYFYILTCLLILTSVSVRISSSKQQQNPQYLPAQFQNQQFPQPKQSQWPRQNQGVESQKLPTKGYVYTQKQKYSQPTQGFKGSLLKSNQAKGWGINQGDQAGSKFELISDDSRDQTELIHQKFSKYNTYQNPLGDSQSQKLPDNENIKKSKKTVSENLNKKTEQKGQQNKKNLLKYDFTAKEDSQQQDEFNYILKDIKQNIHQNPLGDSQSQKFLNFENTKEVEMPILSKNLNKQKIEQKVPQNPKNLFNHDFKTKEASQQRDKSNFLQKNQKQNPPQNLLVDSQSQKLLDFKNTKDQEQSVSSKNLKKEKIEPKVQQDTKKLLKYDFTAKEESQQQDEFNFLLKDQKQNTNQDPSIDSQSQKLSESESTKDIEQPISNENIKDIKQPISSENLNKEKVKPKVQQGTKNLLNYDFTAKDDSQYQDEFIYILRDQRNLGVDSEDISFQEKTEQSQEKQINQVQKYGSLNMKKQQKKSGETEKTHKSIRRFAVEQ